MPYLRLQPWHLQLPHRSTKPFAAVSKFEDTNKSPTPAKDSPAAPVQHKQSLRLGQLTLRLSQPSPPADVPVLQATLIWR